MALVLTKLSAEELKEEFKRSAASDENIQPIIDQFKQAEIGVGDGFKLKVEDEMVDGLTVRAAKRRYNAAAEALNFHLKWKVQGHTERALVKDESGKEFEDDVFFTDWLVVRVDASTPKTENGTGENGEKKRGRPPKQQNAA